MEMFGGSGAVLKLAVRRKLTVGRNFDVSANFDLDDPDQLAEFWAYMEKHHPRVVVMGPPCTSFGPWSHFNRVHNHATWLKNHKIGVRLANLAAEVAMYQLANGRHFLIEVADAEDEENCEACKL